jgi:tetratricopeptide (TPR) repeat protein
MVLGSHGSYELFSGNYESAQIFYEESLSEALLVGDDRLIGIAFYRMAQLAWYRTDNDTAHLLFKDSLIYLHKAGDLRWLALSSNFVGIISAKKGDWQSAHIYYEEALSLAREAHDRLNTSLYLANLGLSRLGIEDFDQALSHLNQAIKLVKNTPDDDFLYLILKGLGDIAHFLGNIEASFTFYHEGLACAQWESDRANVYCLVANAERLCGQVTEAKHHLLAGLQLMKTKVEWGFSADYVIPYIAYFAIDCQLFKQAISFLGWIEGQNKAKKIIRYPVYQAEFDRYLLQAREQLSEFEFNAAWGEGQPMSQEQVIALAMEILQ